MTETETFLTNAITNGFAKRNNGNWNRKLVVRNHVRQMINQLRRERAPNATKTLYAKLRDF